MPIIYRKNILKELKKKGYNTTRLRKEKILSESVIQSIREQKSISLKSIERICNLLECDIEEVFGITGPDGRDRKGHILLSYKQFDDDDDDE